MSERQKTLRILFVCHGNICRSPAAEGAFLDLIKRRGIEDHFIVDSAGTSSFHVGERPHPDTRKAARDRGITLNHQARQFRMEDFQRFDRILAMDHKNLDELMHLARNPAESEKIVLFRTFDPQKNAGDSVPDVPDPYYGGYQGFLEVQKIVARTAEGLLEHLQSSHPHT